MNILFYISIIVFTGIIISKVLSKFKLPKVTGYLIGGLIIGPSLLGIIPGELVGDLRIISDMALAFIAYNIGSEFNFIQLKKMGRNIITITLFQTLATMFFVTIAIAVISGQPFSFSLVLGAISAATAPAATVMVIRQYRAKGEVVDTLLPVVALDDAICIIAFGIAASVARALLGKAGTISFSNMFVIPLMEVAGALVLGLLMGIFLILLIRKIHGETELMSLVIAVVLATAAVSIRFNLSSLLSCMMLGATLVNTIPNFKRAFTITDRFTPALYVAFFTASGVELNLSVLKAIGLVGIVYIVSRGIGKLSGSYLGAKMSRASANVHKYLGFTLLPQAGVAIGLSMVAKGILPDPYGEQVRTIVLAGTMVFELIGPVITKYALIKAGEIKQVS
ncbi:MAG: cation:proton antiporter [Halanaerobiaceae bacterium]|nr:cation:proton antiporter [Halanaerobiaceae bacterium]